MKKNRIYRIICAWMCIQLVSSCGQFLDVIPDNVATVEHAFALRTQARKYLFTCYSYMPRDGNLGADPAMEGGDEIWRIIVRGGTYFNIARGFQGVVSPYGDGLWTSLYQGIRDCNIFLENIDRVPDILDYERNQWIAEVKFLKAYYHFYLVRMYGPIPIVRENLPISADETQVQVSRDPVDDCIAYAVSLIDEAFPDLPLLPIDATQEAGRITQVIAASFKAKLLVYAASPLFNGNMDMATLKNKDGTPLFSQEYDHAKWVAAAAACKAAIDLCHEAGLSLYEFGSNYQQFQLTDSIATQLSIRNSVCERWNSEIIWANTLSTSGVQGLAFPLMDTRYTENYIPRGELSPPLKIAEMFYTRNGVPIEKDKTWDYGQRYTLRTAEDKEGLYIRSGYTTANLHFDREPRFYASLGFDGGIWYGQGNYNDKQPMGLFYVQAKRGQLNSMSSDRSTVTGYFIKKLIHFENVVGPGTSYSVRNYPWPILRLADLYLLYSEAVNEADGPVDEAYEYLDRVRERAGLQPVKTAWEAFAINPVESTTQDGLREIIKRERLIELAFEGERFWDLRRWKDAGRVMNSPIQGWSLGQTTAEGYYNVATVFRQSFGIKDYFWPISENNLITNGNLVQNPGW